MCKRSRFSASSPAFGIITRFYFSRSDRGIVPACGGVLICVCLLVCLFLLFKVYWYKVRKPLLPFIPVVSVIMLPLPPWYCLFSPFPYLLICFLFPSNNKVLVLFDLPIVSEMSMSLIFIFIVYFLLLPLGLFAFCSSFHFHALEKEMATHSSVLAWRIPGTGEPGGMPSMGSHRVRHDWSDLAAAAAAVYIILI